MPSRTTEQRHQGNIESLRALVDAGSPCIVRGRMEGSAISGARRKFPLPSIGHRSGHLVVSGYLRGARGGVAALIVVCDCGRPEYTVDKQNFKNFCSTRCPVCAKSAASQKRYWRYTDALPDDEHRRRLLNRLAAAIGRCTNPRDKGYKHYGARGISIWPKWLEDRAAFLRYIQRCPGWDDPSLEMDRKDNSKGYVPGNLRFVTRAENASNKRRIEDLEAEVKRLRRALSWTKKQVPGSHS